MPEIVPLVVVVIGGTFYRVIVRRRMTHILMITLAPGQLSKIMSNRVQNLYLSRVLLPY